MPTQKLFCYVDETGQDSHAQFFIVSVVITAAQRTALQGELARIERVSGKGRVKWIDAKLTSRLAYMQDVLRTPLFRGTLRYATYRHVTQYFGPTVLTVARAVMLAAVPNAGVRREEADALMCPGGHACRFRPRRPRRPAALRQPARQRSTRRLRVRPLTPGA